MINEVKFKCNLQVMMKMGEKKCRLKLINVSGDNDENNT